jgi:FtsP/CotA-like multicopper oxidase with cupredoxin domain
MESSFTRRRLLKYGTVGVAGLGFGLNGAWRAAADDSSFDQLRDHVDPYFDRSPVGPPFTQSLVIPPALSPSFQTATTDVYAITEQRASTEFVPGIATPIWGYNGIFPGPTILARKGRPVQVTFTNGLPPNEDPSGLIDRQPVDPAEYHFTPSSTVVHLHGLNGDHASDGYPENVKRPGESFTHHYPNNDYQRPATLWYHDHSIHITSHHVYRGLSAFYILTDEEEDALNLPNGYGVHDIPLLFKDVMIDPATGVLLYPDCDHIGEYADVMTVNGKQQPRFEVGTRKYRFRLLNGSDSRQYLLALQLASQVGSSQATNQPLTVIGSDQGLLAAPEPSDRVHIAPSERFEMVVDFSGYPVGTRLVLVNLLVDPAELKIFRIMAFDVTRSEADESTIPPVLRPAEHPADTEAPSRSRLFEFNRANDSFTINERQWDPLRVDAFPVLDTTEEWTLVYDSGEWGHPVHIHLGRFRIVGIEGRPPRPGESGFKDVVWVGPNQTIRVIHQFWNFTGRYVFHCHNGSHEDGDMMSQFEVVPG